MKFGDITKIAFKNLKNNFGRTFVTMIIVIAVSTLIMTVCIIGLSFTETMNGFFKELFKEEGNAFYLNQRSEVEGDNYKSFPITQEEMEIVFSALSKHKGLIEGVEISGYLNNGTVYIHGADEEISPETYRESSSSNRASIYPVSYYADLNTPDEQANYIYDGPHWTQDDVNKYKVWVTREYLAKLAALGEEYEMGDTVQLVGVINKYPEVSVSVNEYTIAGILDEAELKKVTKTYYEGIDIIMDIYDVMRLLPQEIEQSQYGGYNQYGFIIYSLKIHSMPKNEFDYQEEYNKISKAIKEVNSKIQPNIYKGKVTQRFSNDFVDNTYISRIISWVVIGVCVFASFMILLISIGSVANSIIISVDKNRKFYGLMMAMGLKDKGIKKLVQTEATITILVSVLISYGILYLLKGVIRKIIGMISKSLFSSLGTVVMPLYVPAATVVIFVAMALLFSRSSLGKIAKMDVMSVISEVA